MLGVFRFRSNLPCLAWPRFAAPQRHGGVAEDFWVRRAHDLHGDDR